MAIIVELFGPPGAGKTTFAKALSTRLLTQTATVGLHLSARPGEAGEGGPTLGGLHRIARPLWRIISSGGARAPAVEPLLAGLGSLKVLRMRQYLIRLAEVWDEAARSPGVFIFDQAYLQFIVTILARDPQAGSAEIVAALELAPLSDVALRIEAARTDLTTRLDERRARVGVIGRLLEAGASDIQRYAALSREMQKVLESKGRKVLRVSSGADENFIAQVERAARVVNRSEPAASIPRAR